eukprot:2570862-Rhodomonas_salina.1
MSGTDEAYGAQTRRISSTRCSTKGRISQSPYALPMRSPAMSSTDVGYAGTTATARSGYTGGNPRMLPVPRGRDAMSGTYLGHTAKA